MNTDIEQRATDESERLRRLLFDCGVSEEVVEILEPMIENTAYMRIKLDETRKIIGKTDVVIPYDNGGGQAGIRENPIFKGYEGLFKSYMAGLKCIMDVLPKQAEPIRTEELERPKTMLELVRERKNA